MIRDSVTDRLANIRKDWKISGRDADAKVAVEFWGNESRNGVDSGIGKGRGGSVEEYARILRAQRDEVETVRPDVKELPIDGVDDEGKRRSALNGDGGWQDNWGAIDNHSGLVFRW